MPMGAERQKNVAAFVDSRESGGSQSSGCRLTYFPQRLLHGPRCKESPEVALLTPGRASGVAGWKRDSPGVVAAVRDG